jgi:hypothetical protein
MVEAQQPRPRRWPRALRWAAVAGGGALLLPPLLTQLGRERQRVRRRTGHAQTRGKHPALPAQTAGPDVSPAQASLREAASLPAAFILVSSFEEMVPVEAPPGPLQARSTLSCTSLCTSLDQHARTRAPSPAAPCHTTPPPPGAAPALLDSTQPKTRIPAP